MHRLPSEHKQNVMPMLAPGPQLLAPSAKPQLEVEQHNTILVQLLEGCMMLNVLASSPSVLAKHSPQPAVLQEGCTMRSALSEEALAEAAELLQTLTLLLRLTSGVQCRMAIRASQGLPEKD